MVAQMKALPSGVTKKARFLGKEANQPTAYYVIIQRKPFYTLLFIHLEGYFGEHCIASFSVGHDRISEALKVPQPVSTDLCLEGCASDLRGNPIFIQADTLQTELTGQQVQCQEVDHWQHDDGLAEQKWQQGDESNRFWPLTLRPLWFFLEYLSPGNVFQLCRNIENQSIEPSSSCRRGTVKTNCSFKTHSMSFSSLTGEILVALGKLWMRVEQNHKASALDCPVSSANPMHSVIRLFLT